MRNKWLLFLYFRSVMVLLLSFIVFAPAQTRKKLSSKDSLQLKIDSINTAFLYTKKQYDVENEKAYLKQKYDTAKLFNLTRTMFLQLEHLDSVDVRRNTKPKFRKKHSELLDNYRRNLYNGGNYFLRKGKNKEAFAFYETYLLSAKMPMFEMFDYSKKDSAISQVAFWAIVAAGLQQMPSGVLRYSPMAMKWTRQEQVLQFEANAYSQLGRMDDYINVLLQGFDRYPNYLFFFNHLIDYYTNTNRLDSALAICNKAMRISTSHSPLASLAMQETANILVAMGKWEECIQVCEKLIKSDSTLSKPFYHLGLCYVNMAEPLTRKDKKEKKALFILAKGYLETYRQIRPKDKEKWAPLLYKVYYNLNLGKQFREMENLI